MDVAPTPHALERIDPATASDVERQLHEERYWWAGSYVTPGMSVMDAACGTGYGKAWFPGARWIGVDIIGGPGIVQADLTDWQGWAGLHYDVFVGVETIEHLADPTNFIQMAKHAGTWVLISTPIIPTRHLNEYHVRDWTPEEVVAAFTDDDWSLVDYVTQPPTYGAWAFGR